MKYTFLTHVLISALQLPLFVFPQLTYGAAINGCAKSGKWRICINLLADMRSGVRVRLSALPHGKTEPYLQQLNRIQHQNQDADDQSTVPNGQPLQLQHKSAVHIGSTSSSSSSSSSVSSNDANSSTGRKRNYLKKQNDVRTPYTDTDSDGTSVYVYTPLTPDIVCYSAAMNACAR
jgi:pentatricopeptide repeat protein